MRRLTQLPNKIRIVSREFKGRDSVAIGVWVAAGGRWETTANKGAAHFLEHIVFKGSRGYSRDAIKQLIEGVGGNINAFTDEEETCYYAKVPAKHSKRSFDILSDICFFPKIAPKDLEKERTVILEEIKMYHDLPQYHVEELLEALLWPRHPLGQSLSGTLESVGGMSASTLKSFKDTYYIPANTVIAASGAMGHEQLVELVVRKLGRLSGPAPRSFLPAPRCQQKAAIHLHFKQTEQMHLALGFLAYETNHKNYYVLALLSVILGGNMSSRLFSQVREKRGLAYSVSSGIKTFHDTGVFMVRAGVDNKKIIEALSLVLKVLDTVAAKGVKADELKRAQEYYMGQFLLGLEDTMDYMLWMGAVLMSRDKLETISDVIRKIKAVTCDEIQRVAKEILNPQKLNVAVVGPMSGPVQKQLKVIAGVR